MANPTKMSGEIYHFLANLIDYPDLKKRVNEAQSLVNVAKREIWTKVSKAIYIILDDRGFVSYVGSVDRDQPSGLAGRMLEHSTKENRERWNSVMILPLEDNVHHTKVLWYEGAIARFLKPYDSKKSPRI